MYEQHLSYFNLFGVKFRKIIRIFIFFENIAKKSELIKLWRNSFNKILIVLSIRMAESGKEEKQYKKEFNLNEDSSGIMRKKEIRKKSAFTSSILFASYKKNENVLFVPGSPKGATRAIKKRKQGSDSVVHSDARVAYCGLLGLIYKSLYSKGFKSNKIVKVQSGLIKMEVFCILARSKLSKIKETSKRNFYHYLKNTGYRYSINKYNRYVSYLSLIKINFR